MKYLYYISYVFLDIEGRHGFAHVHYETLAAFDNYEIVADCRAQIAAMPGHAAHKGIEILSWQFLTVKSVTIQPPRPKIVCLCGSTRFWKTFQEESLRLTKMGIIVLSIGSASASDAEHGITPEEKAIFDELYKRKIEMADEVFVLNVAGYIGESTRAEIDHALSNGKLVNYLEPVLPA